jgi:hypothetical protein
MAAAVVGIAVGMPAAASDTATVTVNATVVGVCKFSTSTATATVSNGGAGSTIDPSLTGQATGQATLQYRCSAGTTPTFASSPTSPTTVACSSGGCSGMSMPVTISYTGAVPGTGMGSGQEKDVNVVATILEADYKNATPGAYTRDLTISITP